MGGKLSKIILFFDGLDEFHEHIVLDQATTIKDVKKFVRTHINALKSNPKNRTFLPYYNRLLKVYKKMKS